MSESVWQKRHATWKQLLLLSCLTLSFILAVHFGLTVLNRPYVGVYTKIVQTQVVVDHVAPYSWAENTGVRPGDKVISINGKNALDHLDVRKHGMIGDAQRIGLERGNSIRQIPVDNEASGWALIVYLVIPSAFFLTCFCLGCFLLVRRQKNEAVSALILFLAVSANVLLEMSGNARHDGWSLKLMSGSLVFGMILMVHFLRNYFASFNLFLLSGRLLFCLYFSGTLIVLYSTVLTEREVNANYPLEMIFSVFVFGLLCQQFIRVYFRIKETEYRRIIEWLMTGFFLALFPFVAFYALPNMIIGDSLIPVEWTTPAVILLPLTLCYLVLNHAFVDMSFIIGRLGYNSVLSFCVTLLILLGYLLAVHQFPAGRPIDVARLGFLVFCMTLLMLYGKEFLDVTFKSRLFPEKERLEKSLHHFLERAKTDYSLRHLGFVIQRAVASRLPVEQADLVRVGEKNKAESFLSRQLALPELVQGMTVSAQPVGRLSKSNDGFTVVLGQREGEKVILAGSWIKPRRALNLDERMWLETLLDYAQVVIENVYQTEALMHVFRQLETDRRRIPDTVNRLLFAISERERERLSRDLHDTNVQDQLAIAREIDAMMDRVSDARAGRYLTDTRERLLDYAEDLRQTIRYLYPQMIRKTGLKPALADLINQTYLSADFHLEAELHVDEAGRRIPKETVLCIYRAVQELLENARKHARCDGVILFVHVQRDGTCTISYRDNGIGLKTAQIDPSFNTMGLSGLLSRVKGLGGQAEITSGKEGTDQAGLSVVITIPARVGQEDDGNTQRFRGLSSADSPFFF
ncbi:hypothetical protein EWH99_08490 [Sporolactobacillus sp. THM7-7]|nr:hypothetical protein EWH99_08490 [Sporolactobacillus sp. THM7-7]